MRALALAALVAGSVAPALPQEERPWRASPPAPLEFRGAGREEPEPDVADVVLGWFGPGDPGHPEFGGFWRGALVALDAENAAGGYRGKPFRLEPAWSETPWKAGIVEVARLVHERGAWAIIGGVDGTTTHLAVQVALKSHVLLLSPGSTDVTADDANVPWLFSLPPSDGAIARALADALAAPARPGGISVVAGTDHDSHATLAALRRQLDARGLSPAALVELPAVDPEPAAAVAQVLRPAPGTLLVIAPPRLAARVVAAARAAGFRGQVRAGPAASRAAFADAAGPRAQGVIVPLLARPSPGEGFTRAFAARWGREPDAAAALGHDAVRLVAAAVRRAGLNRARIRDEVRALAPWSGASGTVHWNARGRNDAPTTLGRWHDGNLVPLGPGQPQP